uniref:Uncharacterized protein n=1 Tax=Strix occidentalis caurina TaxID=311401 RepID=A0A8D0FZH7_STROC
RDPWIVLIRCQNQGEQPARCLPPEPRGTARCLPPEPRGTARCLPPEPRGTARCLPPEPRGTARCLPTSLHGVIPRKHHLEELLQDPAS